MDCSTSGSPVLHHLLELDQTHAHQVGDAIQPSHPLPAPSPPAINLSQHQGLFQWVNSLHQVAMYWSFSFSMSPFNEYSGLISFNMDQFDLLAAQGTLKSLFQHCSSKSSVPRDQFPYGPALTSILTTGKTIALTRWNFIYIYKHICTHTYVRKSFETRIWLYFGKENKSTSIIFFSNVYFSYHVRSKTLSSNVVYVYADKETEMCLNLVTLTVVQLIYNS